MKRTKGFTLIELLVVIGIIGILAAVVLVAVNPGRQFANSRDTKRRSDLYAITNAIYQYSAENNGLIPTDITSTPTNIGTQMGLIDLSQELIPTYISQMPSDPSTGNHTDTGYSIYRDINNRIVATAASELNPTVPIIVTR